MVVDDRDVFVHRVFFFPWRCFHLREWRANNHLYILSTETTSRAAAIHRGISTAENDDCLADRACMFERDRAEPVDADMNVRRALFATGDLQLTSTRRAGADEHSVVILFEHFLQRRDVVFEMGMDPEVENVID